MNLKTALAGCTAALAFATAANANDLRGTYFALEAGVSWAGDNGAFQSTTGAVTSSALFAAEFDTGWAVLGSVGYAFSNGLRAELETGYRKNDIDRLTPITPTGPVATDGELGEFTVMANLLYDFHLTGELSLSIGAGAGVDRAKLKIRALGLDDDDWVFAYQGIVGVNYAIAGQTQIFMNYRYLRADAPEYTVAIAGPSTQRTTLTDDLEKHAVTLGVRFALEGEAAPPPPPAPPAPPPPPPPPAAPPPQFIVFFGLDSAALIPEAQRVIADAAQAAKDFGAAALSIVGHTDSSGAPAYNQRLSEKRAAAVREALIQFGIPADKISASGQGESDLIVRTGDGVKEPQNRRATINLQ